MQTNDARAQRAMNLLNDDIGEVVRIRIAQDDWVEAAQLEPGVYVLMESAFSKPLLVGAVITAQEIDGELVLNEAHEPSPYVSFFVHNHFTGLEAKIVDFQVEKIEREGAYVSKRDPGYYQITGEEEDVQRWKNGFLQLGGKLEQDAKVVSFSLPETPSQRPFFTREQVKAFLNQQV